MKDEKVSHYERHRKTILFEIQTLQTLCRLQTYSSQNILICENFMTMCKTLPLYTYSLYANLITYSKLEQIWPALSGSTV
jgi:hypothetical protein